MRKMIKAILVICLSSGIGLSQTLSVETPVIASGPITNYEAVRRTRVYHIQRTASRIDIDGSIDEEAWKQAEMSDTFYQQDPKTGMPGTERTELRLLYDDDNIYISVVCHQEGPVLISELRRDYAPVDGDTIGVLLDTFDDDRNGFTFQMNPGNAQRDQQIAGSTRSQDWDGVYTTAAKIQAPGWTAEMAIPFKTLRFDPGTSQRWGMNFYRIIRYKNEWVNWSPAPRPFRFFDVFLAGTLEGLEGIRQGRNLKIKPFTVANYRPDVSVSFLRRKEASAGVDLKYGVTSELTLDLTINTDFSQVEADEQQVNLTRFSLFYPEKREFFLENAGIFQIGGQGITSTTTAGQGRDIIPFFSRKIGLTNGEPVPIRGGARLSGRAAGFQIGVLNMQVGKQGSFTANNWFVGRVSKDILANSNIGGFIFNREALDSLDWNRSGGADATFRFLKRRLVLSGFAMKTYTPGHDEKNLAAEMQTIFSDNLWNVRASHVTIQDDYRNDFGFEPRKAIRKSQTGGGLTPRPKTGPIREISPNFESNYITDQTDRLLTRTHEVGADVMFHSGDMFSIDRVMNFERLTSKFQIRKEFSIAQGDYHFNAVNTQMNLSRFRPIYGTVSLKTGDFWTGTLRDSSILAGVKPNVHIRAELTWNRSNAKLVEGAFKTDLVRARLNLAFSARMFLENLLQYNRDAKTLTSNIRFRFMHHPLSDLFVVYNETRGVSSNMELNRAVSVKLTHLFGF